MFVPIIFTVFSVVIAITFYGKSECHRKVTTGGHVKPAEDHCLFSGRVCFIDDFTILNSESDKFKRLRKEPLLVTKDKSLFDKLVKSLKLKLF